MINHLGEIQAVYIEFIPAAQFSRCYYTHRIKRFKLYSYSDTVFIAINE